MDIVVIGGGAAGMMAAITAAGEGHRVTVLERQERVGRKLLATGNGRCNLTNAALSPEHFHGGGHDFIRPALEGFPVEDVLDFFRSLGLLTVTEPGGRVYPLSDQAGSVVDVLRFALESRGVELHPEVEVTAVKRAGRGFRVAAGQRHFSCDKVILCCGGMAGGKVGGTKSGYQLLAALGHRITDLHPALVQLRTDNTFVRSLKGVRADAGVTLKRGRETLAASAGEVQFTDYGVSGPAVFEISRAASCGGEGCVIHLDLLREVSRQEVAELLENRRQTMPKLTNENLLTGILHNRLGRTVLRYAGFDLTSPLSALKNGDLFAIAGAIKDFRLPLLGTQGFDQAQVTAGGADTAEFDPHTLESRLVPGLYAAGEVLDVDGDCGGCNLQWAWASGRLAGRLL